MTAILSRVRRRLAADNDGVLRALAASIGVRPERLLGMALFRRLEKRGRQVKAYTWRPH